MHLATTSDAEPGPIERMMTARPPADLITDASLADVARFLPSTTIGGVQTILRSVRSHLGMDVAFVSQFVGRQRYFRNVDSKLDPAPLHPGDTMDLSEGYCLKVVEGRLPELIPDTHAVPDALSIPETVALPIGAHLSVPIRLRDGHLYGTFCCFSYQANKSLNERDLHFMRAFAEVAAYQIEHDLATGALRNEKVARIDNALAHGAPTIVYQPKVSLDDRRVVGLECLARFDLDPIRGPIDWFTEAIQVDKGGALEMQAIRTPSAACGSSTSRRTSRCA